jgi:hypothetical protein
MPGTVNHFVRRVPFSFSVLGVVPIVLPCVVFRCSVLQMYCHKAAWRPFVQFTAMPGLYLERGLMVNMQVPANIFLFDRFLERLLCHAHPMPAWNAGDASRQGYLAAVTRARQPRAFSNTKNAVRIGSIGSVCKRVHVVIAVRNAAEALVLARSPV